MASRNSKSKSSGLRILWIPGGRKSHPKGRFDSTSKHVTGYGPKQKKSEVWSLGGGRAQKDLLNAEPDTRLLDGPTTSAQFAAPIAGALGVVSTTTIAPDKAESNSKDGEPSETIPPSTINTTTSTTDIEITPIPLNTSTPNSTEASTPTMPAKAINTTTAEIMDENRFSILGKDILEEFDVNDLPSVPKEDPIVLQQQQHQSLLNTSSDTTKTLPASTTTASSPKTDTGESNKDDSAQSNKKLHHRNNNNDNKQSDINSIESISDNNIPKPLNTDFTWIDELYLQHNGNKALERNKRKKKKKHANAKKMDQLDGVPTKQNTSEPSTDEDEKVVKCLYYTLMCCDCSIS